MFSEPLATIPNYKSPQCNSTHQPLRSLASPSLHGNDFHHLVNNCEPEAASSSSNPSISTTSSTLLPASASASEDFLNESFFAVDFPLFGGGDSTDHVKANSNDSFGTDASSLGLPAYNSVTTTSEPALTYIDEEHSYLLTSLDEFLSFPENTYTQQFTPSLDDYLTSPVDSLMSSQQLTPLASPEPATAIATSANASPLILNRPTPPADYNHPLFPTPSVSASATPSVNPLKRKSPSESPAIDIDSPRAKDLPPIQITETDDERDIKRKRNTAAARRYRKKKQDRMEQLEEEIEQLKEEKEQMKEEAMKWKMEAEKYQALVEFLQQSRKASN